MPKGHLHNFMVNATGTKDTRQDLVGGMTGTNMESMDQHLRSFLLLPLKFWREKGLFLESQYAGFGIIVS